MRLQQFQVSFVDKTRQKLPRALRDFHARAFFTLVKLSYAHPKIHYEVAVRGKERLLEIGLHCEDTKSLNDALLVFFESRAFEIHAELGERVEIEQWTNSWSRVHQVMPYTSLDEALVDQVANELARLIAVLEPMVVEFFGAKKTRKRRAGK
jgi:hypothetical protein